MLRIALRPHESDAGQIAGLMVVILYSKDCEVTARGVAMDLSEAFRDQLDIKLISASSISPWGREVEWDDLLIVLYDGTHFPDGANDFILEYLSERQGQGLLLPVACDLAHRRPPRAA